MAGVAKWSWWRTRDHRCWRVKGSSSVALKICGADRGAISPFMRLMEGEERWEAPDHLQGALPQNCDGVSEY
ncbi:hypothetical protein TNCV_3356261 [Trichonephila clavipes]|nr:hypothetical protein TNCV_3356261 [Trichonephila clavipes]